MSEFNHEPENTASEGAAAPSEPVSEQAQQQPQPAQSIQGETTVPTSGLGIAGLVLGILAVPPAFIPLINFLSLPLAIVGVVLAAVGLSGIKKGKAKGKGIAMAGLVLSIIAIAIFVIMYGSAAAVSGTDTSSSSSTSGQESTATEQNANDSSAAEGQTDEQSEYNVKISDAKLGKDYNGDPAIIVTYKWENNSEEKTSFAAAFNAKCYQDGVQLETAIGVDGADSGGYLADVKPGHGTTVQLAYELKNKKDDVEVEVGPLISFDDEVYASKTFSIK